jgi:hypothetical protein
MILDPDRVADIEVMGPRVGFGVSWFRGFAVS